MVKGRSSVSEIDLFELRLCLRLIKGAEKTLNLWKGSTEIQRGTERLSQSMEKEDGFHRRRFSEPAVGFILIGDLDEEGESKLSFCDDGELDRLVLH